MIRSVIVIDTVKNLVKSGMVMNFKTDNCTKFGRVPLDKIQPESILNEIKNTDFLTLVIWSKRNG